jgi:ABC-type nitrate/sulfonate/bicarbonate transport system permease component
MFVGIFVIIALALITHAILVGLKKRLYPWEAEV